MGENVGKLLPYSMYCTQTQDFEKKNFAFDNQLKNCIFKFKSKF